MPRPLRIQYSGARYHVMSRGDGREAIFYDDADRVEFLRTLGQACLKTGWQVHAYCLMSNHFHLVLETPQPNLAVGMKWLLATCTQRFNRRHRHWGHLFGGRYKAQLVGAEDFRDWLADRLARRGRTGERASERRETDSALAERLVREALTRARWREIDLATQPKGQLVKVQIAQQVRHQTPMIGQRIADRLRMGSASYVSNLLSSVDSKL